MPEWDADSARDYKPLPPLFDSASTTSGSTDAMVAISIAGMVRVTDLAKRRGVSISSMLHTLGRLEGIGLVRRTTMNSPLRSLSFTLNKLHPAYTEIQSLLAALHSKYLVKASPPYSMHPMQQLLPPVESKLDRIIGRPRISRALMVIAMLGKVQIARVHYYANVPVTALPNFDLAIRRYRKLGILHDSPAAGVTGARTMVELSQDLPVYNELRTLLLKLAELLNLSSRVVKLNEIYEQQLALAKTGTVARRILMQNPAFCITDEK